MKDIAKLLIILLGAFLPWHGLITVFLPEPFRYWKEIVLVLLCLVALFMKSETLSFGEKIKDYLKSFFGKNKEKRKNFWQKPIFYAALFLIWLGLLSGLEQNYYSSLAARYIGFGFFVFIVFLIFLKKCGKDSNKIFQIFSTTFIVSSVFSVLFGIWGKFADGFEVLKNFYSTTISSWVPGQTIPIYHQVGDMIRMQGGASGPVEFGHLLFVALFLIAIRSKKFRALDLIFLIILLFGIWQSGSRAALGGSVILLVLLLLSKLKNLPDKVLKFTKIWLVVVLFLALAKILVVNFLPENTEQKTINHKQLTINRFLRLSDSDHITRPIQAMKDGANNPIYGQLGSYGPAARTKNLVEQNNDQAPIAENIFADYFVQLGFIGLFLALGFWWTLFSSVSRKSKIFILIAFLLVNLATIFDMTPLSIIFFSVFAFLVSNKE